jgi:hypothetical protein
VFSFFSEVEDMDVALETPMEIPMVTPIKSDPEMTKQEKVHEIGEVQNISKESRLVVENKIENHPKGHRYEWEMV